MRTYLETHRWITFNINLDKASRSFWAMLGECQSKCEHLAGLPLAPEQAKAFHRLYFAKGVQGTTAIEGNTLSPEEIQEQIEGKLETPPSRQYLAQETDNIIRVCNQIGRDLGRKQDARLSADLIRQYNEYVLERLGLEGGAVAGQVSPFMVMVHGYKGAPREDCDYLLSRLADWLNSDDFKQDDEMAIGMGIIKAILAHLYLAWIHPFADGNGRTARLMEFHILFASGVPTPAAHLLSNFYNQTRTEYYRQLDRASQSGGDVIPFLCYAVQGLRDGLREQVERAKQMQQKVAWINYVHRAFKEKTGDAATRQKHLIFDLAEHATPVSPAAIPTLTARLARHYAQRTTKTLLRDLETLLNMELIKKENKGYRAHTEMIVAFLPPRVPPIP